MNLSLQKLEVYFKFIIDFKVNGKFLVLCPTCKDLEKLYPHPNNK